MLGKVVIAGPPSEIKTALRKILSGWVEEVSSVETPRQLVEDCGSIADSPALIVALEQDAAAWNEWCAAVRFQTARFTTRFAVAPRLVRHAGGLVPTDLFDGVYGKVLSTRGVLEMLQGAESDVDSDGQIARLPARSGRILLVEDTAASRLVAKNILENVGYTVELAENGVEATSKIQHDKTYDLVLMDLQMPKMDGYEATRFIRKIREDLPIVALSADVTAAEQAKVRAVDFDDYLEKPLDRDILLCTVERRMSRPAYNSSSCPEKFLEPSEV